MAHITGGGIPGNLVRILPEGLRAVVKKGSWEIPKIFKFIKEKGKVPEEEMFKTFNMGIGYCVVVSRSEAERAKAFLEEKGERVFEIGEIEKGEKGVVID